MAKSKGGNKGGTKKPSYKPKGASGGGLPVPGKPKRPKGIPVPK